MNGTSIGTADEFRAAAASARSLLGNDLVTTLIPTREATATPVPLGVFDVVRAFSRVDEWASSLDNGTAVRDATELVHFAMTCQAINRGAALAGGSDFIERLRHALRAGALDQFENFLFEAEVAMFLEDQLRAQRPRFGPPSGHPDLAADLVHGSSSVPLAIECKRIQPVGSITREFNRFAQTVESLFQEVVATHGPLKCIVWLHTGHERLELPQLAEIVRGLSDALPDASPSDHWVTANGVNGWFQVSLARLGAVADFQTQPARIDDVPAEPILIPKWEFRRASTGSIEGRVKSVLSLRSDVLTSRIGNLRENINTAIDQLLDFSPNKIGVIAVRIRRPRALGDLWEGDQAVRASLVRKGAHHVSLVMFFWDESATGRDPDQEAVPDSTGTPMYASFSLRPYLIANPAARFRFDQIDSQSSIFPTIPQAFIREPTTGDIRPIDPLELARLEDGAALPPAIASALAGVPPLPEETGEATIYWKLRSQLKEQLVDELMGVVPAGKRQFRVFMEQSAQLRVVEISRGTVANVATIDLRAWLTQRELGLILSWDRDGFRAALWCPDGVSRLEVCSSKVPWVPLQNAGGS